MISTIVLTDDDGKMFLPPILTQVRTKARAEKIPFAVKGKNTCCWVIQKEKLLLVKCCDKRSQTKFL
jgi:hypothetical protein